MAKWGNMNVDVEKLLEGLDTLSEQRDPNEVTKTLLVAQLAIAHADRLIPEQQERIRKLEEALNEALPLLVYPENGDIYCRWCGNDVLRNGHVEQCWYSRRVKDVADMREKIAALLAPPAPAEKGEPHA